MEEETRDEIEAIVNNEEIVKEEIKEAIVKEIKPKAKRASRAKVKIVKESVEPVEPIVVEEKPVEVVVEEQPKKVDKLKAIVKCPDCNMDMTVHTLKYIHKRRGFCNSEKTVTETVIEKAPEPNKKSIPEDIVNDYIKDHPDTVSNYLRNERSMKAQKKQMIAKSLLNNAF